METSWPGQMDKLLVPAKPVETLFPPQNQIEGELSRGWG